jgi:hypothetical protein
VKAIAAVVIGVFALALLPANAESQSIEGRIDGIADGPPAVHAGAGFTVRAGTYLRSGVIGAIGASRDGISGRVDFINRFQLDPFREHRWAPYSGGGLTARFDDNRSNRFYLLLIAGIDGPATRGLTTAIEAGLGGGARLGVILRHATAERR